MSDHKVEWPWHTVAIDGLPKYQPDVTYIGINSAGFAACFTVAEPDGTCWMHTGEESICVMSDLRDWRLLDRPTRGVPVDRPNDPHDDLTPGADPTDRAGVPVCQHRLADARNEAIESGYVCVDCGAMFAAVDHGVLGTPEASDETRNNTGENHA